ncbi:MAG TPA: hypothetical protein VGY58_07955 [Gemmataceae bacterium]|nr:hypothetical protein [Gemmataceae bacterium]
MTILQELHKEGRTVVLATHERPIASLVDQVYVLERGMLQL